MPLPGTDADHLLEYFIVNAGVLTSVGMLQLGAAVALAAFVATATHCLEDVTDRAPVAVALVGGSVAAAMMALSGLITAAGGASALHLDRPTVALLHQLSFFVGGVGFIVFLGLLIAGTAVAAWVAGLVPRWLGMGSVAVAAVAETSILSLAIEPLTLTIPLARLIGTLALLGLALSLSTRRFN